MLKTIVKFYIQKRKLILTNVKVNFHLFSKLDHVYRENQLL
jgi:hypothetical protein